MFLRDIGSIQTTINTLLLFYSASGLKLNNGKTVVLPIGKNCNKPQTNLFGLQWESNEVLSLGIWFSCDISNLIKKNHDLKLEKIRNILNHWSKFNLTLLGKVTVLKSLALANINFLISSVYTPDWFINDVQQLALQFLWDNKPNKIKTSTLYNTIEDGGIKFPHVESYVKAQKCSWIKRLMSNSVTKSYLESLIPVPLEIFVRCNVKLANESFNLPKFYNQVFNCWFNLNEEPNSANEVLQEYICLNKFIEINNKMVLDEEFIRPKTLKIGDIVKNNGRFLTHEEFQRKFNRRINWLKLHSVTLAIPNKWRQILNMNTSFENIEICETRITMLNNVSSKKCYWSLVKKVITKPTCINSWDAKGFVFNDETWKKLFLLPKFTTYNIKITMLQYKILHRIYASKSKVSKFVPEISGKCEYCNIEKNIVHTFYECEEIKTFWQNFKTWFNHITNINLELRIDDIIFGIHRTIPFNTVINFCILIGKFFIHMCNNDRKRPSLMDYIPTLKHHLTIEKQVYDKKGKSGKFCMLFGQLHANICT